MPEFTFIIAIRQMGIIYCIKFTNNAELYKL